ncbi:MAG: DUF4350 domain-containing protein [Bradymonadaceae bacterium]
MKISLAICLLLPAGSVFARGDGEADYDVSNTGWAGLSNFVDIFTEADVQLRYSEELDYSTLRPEDVVVIIYPQQPLATQDLTHFVIDGGRIFLADDFGQSDAFLDRISLSRMRVAQGNLPHDEYVDDRAALPILRPRGRHPLLEDVAQVIANHPSLLFNVGGPVISYSGGGGLVYDMTLGDGRVVVLADSSMLINLMLPMADNRRFVENAIAYLCEGQPQCRVILLIRNWDESGSYSTDSRESTAAAWTRTVDRINDALKDLMDDLPVEQLFYYLSLLLVAGLAAYLATVFPLRASRAYSRYIADTVENVPAPQTEFDWNIARFGQGQDEINYILPIAILKEVFEELFLNAMGQWPSKATARPGVEELGALFAEKYLQAFSPPKRKSAQEEVVDILATFAQIPTRHRVFLDSDAFFGEREMLRIYRRAMRILRIMGLEEEYERRTRNLV